MKNIFNGVFIFKPVCDFDKKIFGLLRNFKNYYFSEQLQTWVFLGFNSFMTDVLLQICSANQWTDFYIIETSVMKELIHYMLQNWFERIGYFCVYNFEMIDTATPAIIVCHCWRCLTLSWRRSLPFGNQSIDLLCKSTDCFL